MKENKISWGRALIVAGAFFAANVGAGTASGQDLLQYFANFGLTKALLGWAVMMVTMLVMNPIIMVHGYDEIKTQEQSGSVFQYYCGKYIGWGLRILIPVFLLGTAVAMCSAAGAVFEEYWGLPHLLGTGIVVVVMTVCYLMGTRKLINILGGIGPFIIVFTLIVSLYATFAGTEMASSDAFLAENPGLKVSEHWWFSGVLFGVFAPFIMAQFLQEMGAGEKNRKSLIAGSLIGIIGYCLVCLLIVLAELANISAVSTASVPTLVFANMLHPFLGNCYAVIIVLAIYSTVAPLHWSFCQAFPTQEKPAMNRLIAIASAVVILVGGQLPFSTLVNVLYPFIQYFGVAFLVFVVAKWAMEKFAGKGTEK